jgi:hypothetical protein
LKNFFSKSLRAVELALDLLVHLEWHLDSILSKKWLERTAQQNFRPSLVETFSTLFRIKLSRDSESLIRPSREPLEPAQRSADQRLKSSQQPQALDLWSISLGTKDLPLLWLTAQEQPAWFAAEINLKESLDWPNYHPL